jgi:hypothetical protein
MYFFFPKYFRREIEDGKPCRECRYFRILQKWLELDRPSSPGITLLGVNAMKYDTFVASWSVPTNPLKVAKREITVTIGANPPIVQEITDLAQTALPAMTAPDGTTVTAAIRDCNIVGTWTDPAVTTTVLDASALPADQPATPVITVTAVADVPAQADNQ